MATAATRKRILDAAELTFANEGYGGASIRSITGLAGVDLGAVRYHFGTKDQLLGAVLKRRLDPLCKERLRLLELAQGREKGSAPRVEEIVHAFFYPAICLVTHKGYGRSWMKLMGRVRIEPGRYLESIRDVYEDLLKRYLDAFHRALPEVPADELAYRLYFMFGTGVTTMINDGTLRAVGGELSDVTQEPDEVLDRLVRFVCAGMSAPFDSSPEEPQHNGSVRAEFSGNSVF